MERKRERMVFMKLHLSQNLITEPYEKKWQFAIGSCHAATLLRKDAIDMLSQVHQDLGIQYVRCHGIFNDDMNTINTFSNVLTVPGSDKFQEYSFYKVGVVYDNLLSIGMRPFVELSFMPKMLAVNKDHGKSFYGSLMCLPEDYKAWSDYIKAFITFLLHRYGEEEVSKWYFEVWNEPDLQGMFFQGTQEDYFQLYQVTATAIKEVCPSLQVGGPSTSGSKWITSFIEHCESNHLPLDFVSTHQYAGDPFLGISDDSAPDGVNNSTDTAAPAAEEYNMDAVQEQMAQLAAAFQQMPAETPFLTILRTMMPDPSETTEMDRDVFTKNAQIVKKQAKDYPVFYTEWNFSASFGCYSNDTTKVASYDLRTALSTNPYVDGSSIWCYSDIFEELHQFTEEFHGGFGLQTIHGIKKPVYHGLQMLADAGDKRILLSPECLMSDDASNPVPTEAAAFESPTEKQILLFRQSMKQLDLPAEEVSISVELPQMPKQVYLQRIDATHCNPLKLWEEDGCPKDLTPVQISSLKDNDVYFLRIVK